MKSGNRNCKKKNKGLTVLAVPSHVLPRTFTGVVGNPISADASILTRVSFTFINICQGRARETEKRHVHFFEAVMLAIS